MKITESRILSIYTWDSNSERKRYQIIMPNDNMYERDKLPKAMTDALRRCKASVRHGAGLTTTHYNLEARND